MRFLPPSITQETIGDPLVRFISQSTTNDGNALYIQEIMARNPDPSVLAWPTILRAQIPSGAKSVRPRTWHIDFCFVSS